MAMRRGFKTQANQIAREVRGELGLGPTDPLDPWKLAAFLDIPVIGLTDLAAAIPDAVHHFQQIEPGAFSAATVFAGTRRIIVHNDVHSPARQASNVTHEDAHGLLLHEPTPAFGLHGCRIWRDGVEEEAQLLAGVLLITEETAVAVARSNLPIAAAATRYGVSEQMMQYRLNMTGAYRRVRRR
jgi:Zn-dependent peptidase ImmA (M78 family)